MPEPRSGIRAPGIRWGWWQDILCALRGHQRDVFGLCPRCGFPTDETKPMSEALTIPAPNSEAAITVCKIEDGYSVVSLACDLGNGRDGVLVDLGATGLFRLAQACMKRYAELVLDG